MNCDGSMVKNIKYSHEFLHEFKRLKKKYRSLEKDFGRLLLSLVDNPLQGTALALQMRKIRLGITSKRKGTRGGARVIIRYKIENGEFTDVYYYNGIFRAKIKNSKIKDENFPAYSDFYCEIALQKDYEDIKDAINEANATEITIKFDSEPTRESFLSTIMPYISLAIILIIGYVLLRAIMKGNAGTLSFGKSRARSQTMLTS